MRAESDRQGGIVSSDGSGSKKGDGRPACSAAERVHGRAACYQTLPDRSNGVVSDRGLGARPSVPPTSETWAGGRSHEEPFHLLLRVRWS